jgi:hypothetical protein
MSENMSENFRNFMRPKTSDYRTSFGHVSDKIVRDKIVRDKIVRKYPTDPFSAKFSCVQKVTFNLAIKRVLGATSDQSILGATSGFGASIVTKSDLRM